MAAQDAGGAGAADASGPRFAPDDPSLPAPWKVLIDGATLYYWNSETNVTQYEKPAAAAAAPPLPAGPPPATPAQVPESAPGAFSQPGMQFGQVGQAAHQERPGQAGYPQAAQLGQQQQQTQQPAQKQSLFQQVAQHQPPFQQVPYQQQQPQMPNHPPQYPNPHPQHMPYQQGPYMQPQQHQQGPPYSYQAEQQPQMPQTAYNQAQQPPMPQPSYNQGQGQGQQPPMPQPSYNQGQQPVMPQSGYNHAQQPQIPHGAYNQSQQPQGMRIPPSQGQHPQQSLGFHHPAQAPQLPQVSQSQGHQMPSQQGQLQHGLQFPQHGKQPLLHGQQSPLLKDDDTGGHEAKRTGFSLPLSQQRGQAPLSNQQLPSSHQHPGAVNQPNVPGVGGPLYPAKHLQGGSSPAEINNIGFMNSPAQRHQGGVDANYRQPPVSSHAVPNHVGPSPVRPPLGFEMGNSDVHFERDDPHSYGRFDGANTVQQQPKLAAIPPSQNALQGIRNGPPYPQPDNFGGYNMAPPHSVPNPHNHGPLPIGAPMRPPSRMFAPPDLPGIPSADAYRQHHEVTAMGENVPAPFMTFEATGFPPEILREIIKCG